MEGDDRTPAQPADSSNEQTPGDYSYDMAHDVAATEHPDRPEARGARHGGQGAAEAPPPDQDSDYSYDLAHEVPPARQ